MDGKKAKSAEIDSKKINNPNDIWNILSNFLFIFLILLLILYIVQIITDQTDHPDELLIRARTQRDNGQFLQSKQTYEEYIKRFGDEPEGYIEFAQLLLENGFFSESKNVLDQLNEPPLNPRIRSEYHLVRGRNHERSGEYLTALTNYREAYRLNEFNIMNGLMLITMNIRIPERTDPFIDEFNNVMAQLKRLTDDQTVFTFIQACLAYEASDYLYAYELFEKSASSEIPFVRYESFRQMMNLLTKTETDLLVILSYMEEIIQMAEALDSSRLLVHSLEEIYAVSLFNASKNEGLSKQTRTEMLNKSEYLFHDLFISGVANPNVYLCYAAILKYKGDYRSASEILTKAEQIMGDNIRVLIHRVYTTVGYEKSTGSRNFDGIRELNDRIENLFSEQPAYMTDMIEYREFIGNMSRMGLL